MKLCYLRSTALLAGVALIATGCQNLTPGENAAVFGGASGVAAGALARAAGLSTAQSIATGAAVGAVVAATTYIIAKHQASVRQRRIAEQRARAFYARMSESKKVSMKKKRVRYIAVDTEKDQRSSPRAKKSIMIWDTQTREVVGNEVYDVSSAPAKGQVAQWGSVTARYVGNGL